MRNAHRFILIAAVAILMAACRPATSVVTVVDTESTGLADEVPFGGRAASSRGGTVLTVRADEFAFGPDTWRVAAN